MKEERYLKGGAWSQQRRLRYKDIISQEDLIKQIESTYSEPVDKCLIAILYLTGARISEVVKTDFLIKNIYKMDGLNIARNNHKSPIILRTEKIPHGYKGIKIKDVVFDYDNDIVIFGLENRKHRTKKRKHVPSPIYSDIKIIEGETIKTECYFVNIARLFIANKALDNPIFNFGYRKAYTIIKKLGINPHYIRRIRLTHLVTIYGFNDQELTKMAGWTNSLPASVYVNLSNEDLINRFKSKQR
jgi:integrase